MGNYMSMTPTREALQAIKDLMRCGVDKSKVKWDYAVGSHCNFASKKIWSGKNLHNAIRGLPRYKSGPSACDGL